MSIIRNILVRVGADITPMQRNMTQAQQTMRVFQTDMRAATSQTQSSMTAMSSALNLGRLKFIALGAAAAAAMVAVGKTSIKSAMDVVESESLFSVSMGNMASSARKWSESLQDSLGLNAYEVRKNVGLFYNMTTSMGLAQAQAYQVSTGLTQLAYDMSSFYNQSPEEMFEKLQSGLSGEVEPLKRLGIIVNETTTKNYAYANGLANVGTQLTETQKVMARYGVIMEQTKNAQGDLARTINSPANQLRLLQTQLQLASINLGNAFLPIVQIILPILVTFAKELVVVTNTFAQFMSVVFGTNKAQVQNAQTANEAASAQANLGNAATKAAAKAKKGVAGFDQLNTLQQSIADNASAVADALDESGSTMPVPSKQDSGTGVIPEAVIQAATKTRAAIDSIKQSAGEVAQYLTPLMSQIISTVGYIASGTVGSLLLVFNSLQAAVVPIVQWFVSQGLPLLMSFASGAITILKSFFDYAKNEFDTLEMGVVYPAMQFISNVILDSLNLIKGFWDKYGADIVAGVVATFNTMRDLFNTLWNTMLAPIVKGMTEELTWLWGNHLKGVVAELLDFIGKLITGATEIYNQFIAPIAKNLIEIFGPGFANAFTLITGIIGTFLGVIADIAKGIIRVLTGITDFITGVFTGNWSKAWSGVREIFSGIFTSLGGIVKGAMNLIIDSINWMIRGLDRISFSTPDWVPGVGGNSFGINIPTIPKLASGGIITAPTLAMMGEGGKREAVVPLENSAFIDSFAQTIASAVAQVLGSHQGSGGGDATVILKIGESEFGRAAIKSINSVHRQTGMTLLTI